MNYICEFLKATMKLRLQSTNSFECGGKIKQSTYTQNIASLEFSTLEFIFNEWMPSKDNFIQIKTKSCYHSQE